RRPGYASALPKSTVSDMLSGKRVPPKDKLLTLLAACGVPADQMPHWIAAWETGPNRPGSLRTHIARRCPPAGFGTATAPALAYPPHDRGHGDKLFCHHRRGHVGERRRHSQRRPRTSPQAPPAGRVGLELDPTGLPTHGEAA